MFRSRTARSSRLRSRTATDADGLIVTDSGMGMSSNNRADQADPFSRLFSPPFSPTRFPPLVRKRSLAQLREYDGVAFFQRGLQKIFHTNELSQCRKLVDQRRTSDLLDLRTKSVKMNRLDHVARMCAVEEYLILEERILTPERSLHGFRQTINSADISEVPVHSNHYFPIESLFCRTVLKIELACSPIESRPDLFRIKWQVLSIFVNDRVKTHFRATSESHCSALRQDCNSAF